ncbi:hypothetical protein DFH29DRAFT_968273 [Suillus ampliporus]|nr:hypothetical protein DFH29DRAFT_968273 [Suillus ampliporus]
MFSLSLLLALEPPGTAEAPGHRPPTRFEFPQECLDNARIQPRTNFQKIPKQPKARLLILYSRARPSGSWVAKSTGSTGDARVKQHFRISRLYAFPTQILSRD